MHVEPEVTFALPPPASGCTGATRAAGGGTTRVPLTVSTVAGQVAESVNVCIGGKGPSPSSSTRGRGSRPSTPAWPRGSTWPPPARPTAFAGVGCTGTARPVSVGSWSLDGVGLAPQQLTAATLPQIGGKGEPVGLLGSDVLARFGAVRIDFAAGALVLPGPEGAPLSASSPYTGPHGPAAGRADPGEAARRCR